MKTVLLVLLTCCALVASAVAQVSDLQNQIVAKEREELEALKAADYQKFADLIADDAVFVAPQGMAAKSEVVENVRDFKLLDFTMSDVRFVPLSASSGAVAYKLTETASSHGQEFTTEVYASAVWIRRDGQWVSIFSQETPARKDSQK
jgi:ketosteroid isomerase-like protein